MKIHEDLAEWGGGWGGHDCISSTFFMVLFTHSMGTSSCMDLLQVRTVFCGKGSSPLQLLTSLQQ